MRVAILVTRIRLCQGTAKLPPSERPPATALLEQSNLEIPSKLETAASTTETFAR
jgi:hypothetical protein